MVYVAAFTKNSKKPCLSHETTTSHLQKLLNEYPILTHTIKDHKLPSVHWTLDKSITADKRITSHDFHQYFGKDLDNVGSSAYQGDDASMSILMQTLLKKEVLWTQKELNAETGKYFWVTRIDGGDQYPSFIAFTIDHILADGRSCLELLSRLIQPTDPGPNHAKFPGIFEDVIPTNHSWMEIAKEAYDNLVIPSLPAMVRKTLGYAELWPMPAHVLNKSQEKQLALDKYPIDFIVNVIPQDALDRVHKVSKARGISIHGSLLAAVIISLRKTIPQEILESQDKFSFVIDSPMDERSAQTGQPDITGNFISEGTFRHTLNTTESPDDPATFWKIAEAVTKDVKGDMRAEARAVWGMLGMIKNEVDKGTPETREAGVYTGWERFFYDKIQPPHNLKTSLELSNLGRFDFEKDFGSAQAVTWSQSVSPFTKNAFECAVVTGAGRGLWMSWGWREGVSNASLIKDVAAGVVEVFESDMFRE